MVLTDEQREYLQLWMRRQADRLGLRDWQVLVTRHAPSDADSYATSYVRDNTEETVVAVGKDFAGRLPDAQRQTLAHELLHCHFYPVTRMAERLVESELGKRTEAVVGLAVEITEERAIDRLAHAIAAFMEPVELPKGAVA